MYTKEAQAQTRLMEAAAERIHPGAIARLRADPLGELSNWDDLVVIEIDESSDSSTCSVAGNYQPNPPTLVVTKSLSPGRRGFTALHELGHHLQETDISLGSAVFGYSDPDQFEEEACDAFAAGVLLPDNELRARIGSRGPTAQDVVDLYSVHSTASREACCVWAARHLEGAGAVVLLNSAGVVRFAAPKSFIPPAKNSDQAHTPLIEAALRNRYNGATRDETFVTYRNGGTSDTLYGQARWFDANYLVAVLARDNAAWKPLALPRPYSGSLGSPRWWTCETCDDSFSVAERCSRCGEPQCTNGHCGCHAKRVANDRTCPGCFLVLHSSRFDEGSELCRDCT
jgi:Zn-dependent peptidase ImmA (M78 family)